MTKEMFSTEDKVLKKHPPEQDDPAHDVPDRQEVSPTGITLLQQQVGNRAVQLLLSQRSSGTASSSQSFEVEDEVANRIEKERGGGQALDSGVQKKMGAKMGPMGTSGFDFSQVKVHASPEADALNRELGAEAFTTGNDIYFREGTYDPNSSKGQELLAHEMTHVVQQSSGLAGGESKMTVNAPDDAYEKNADAVAQDVTRSPGASQSGGVQRQEMPEEEEVLTKRAQRQEMPEEEEIQTRRIQRQEMPEEEELQAKHAQRQEVPEEEELQTKRSGRQSK